ncbi:glycoside hydrolase family 72 protein [Acidomyces richmondensis BFW]|nr:MAG: glycoside hydrolase family 72 protein [Acidomyces sp. 'richmondensis']KYG42517.1 glycoside hydrolase family 72 protein [Acidomyces richmondensis BFW]
MAPLTSILAALCALVVMVSALNPIIVQEQEFIDSVTHDRFMVIGVDYQPGGQAAYGTGVGDPLSDPSACLRDAALMQNLGVNTIRCYNVAPNLNHDECASIFNAVGIYMLIDVNSPLAGQSLNRNDPSGSYTLSYLEHIFSVVEAFKGYPNLLGFVSGNEIINDVATAQANPPYMRAVTRDLKNYIAAQASRQIPVGYSAADVANVLVDTWEYLQCNNSVNNDPNSRSDFFGLNSYSWCGNGSSFTISGYNVLVEQFSNTTIPVFFSEYGCNVPSPRYFDEVPVLYGPQMTVLSGGLVYQWTQSTANYGLVQVYSNGSAQLLFDYDTLMAQYDKLNITLLESSNITATSLSPPACNANLITGGDFNNNFTIPDPPQGADALISSGISSAPTGTLTSVTATSVTQSVYAYNGDKISDLKITMETAANHPGAATGLSTAGSSATGTASSATPTSSKKSDAFRVEGGFVGSAMAAAVMGAVAFAL